MTETEAELLYANALSVLSEAYYNFPWDDPQSMLVDIERIETNNSSEVKVLVTAQVGELISSGQVDPCETEFPEACYQLYTPTNPANINPSNTYAGIEMTKKFNKKVNTDLCSYYKEVKTIPSSFPNTVVTIDNVNNGFINAQQMENHYCEVRDKVLAYIPPAGFSVISVKVTSDVSPNGNSGAFKIVFTIGKLTQKIPCIVENPKNLPPSEF